MYGTLPNLLLFDVGIHEVSARVGCRHMMWRHLVNRDHLIMRWVVGCSIVRRRRVVALLVGQGAGYFSGFGTWGCKPTLSIFMAKFPNFVHAKVGNSDCVSVIVRVIMAYLTRSRPIIIVVINVDKRFFYFSIKCVVFYFSNVFLLKKR